MKKTLLKGLALAIVSTALAAGSAMATVTPYGAGQYSTPQGWSIIGSVALYDTATDPWPSNDVQLDHSFYFTWTFNDDALITNKATNTATSELRVVFHDVWNWNTDPNWLDVLVFNQPPAGALPLGFVKAGNDGEDRARPDWDMQYNVTSSLLGTWSDYDAGTTKNDVVFSIKNPGLINALVAGNNTFTIGIDPDCHFYGKEITVEVPIPEPATMLLFGTGLIGVAAGARRRLMKKDGKE